jgi:hypothetical protein
MVKHGSKTVQSLAIPVSVTETHINEGIKHCRDPHRCMEKVSVADALVREFGGDPHKYHVRVDGGHIKFNLHGYRWEANTPKIAKSQLICLDQKKWHHRLKPHRYVVHAVRGSKIYPQTKERKEQINAARRARIAAGHPDRKPNRLTLRQRIAGFA